MAKQPTQTGIHDALVRAQVLKRRSERLLVKALCVLFASKTRGSLT